jgi:hypothetical protein
MTPQVVMEWALALMIASLAIFLVLDMLMIIIEIFKD